MIHSTTATLDNVIWTPYRFDRIEVTGRRGTGDYNDCEPVSLSIPGEFLCEFPSGPNLRELGAHVCRIIGPGWYGLASARSLGFWDSEPRLRALYDADCDRRRQLANA